MSDDDAADVEVESPEDPEAANDGETATDAPGRPDGDAPSADNETDDAAKHNGTAQSTAATTADGGPLVDAVAEHDEALAADVAELEAELAETRDELLDAESEVEELTSKLARVRADFSNYKQRAKRKQEEIRERASEALVERLGPVRNNLLRALDQDEGSDLRPGVESTLEQFDEVLAAEGVESIEPDPGDEVDPARHQVMLRVDSDRPEGTVHEVYEPGYEMGDRVVSEAKVTVSDGSE